MWVLLAFVFLTQQAPPATEIFLAPLTGTGASLAVGTPVNISQSPGYDNQPSFLPDGSAVLFTSYRDGGQTDIYKYDIRTKQVAQLTHTEENEYSPLVTPDGKTFSVVRGADQKLWRFDLDGSNPQLVYAHKGLIGYHVWIDATHLAVFVLGEQRAPATLQLVDLTKNTADVVATGIGRSLLLRPSRGTVSFVSKPATGPWVVTEFNPRTQTTTPIVKTIEGVEDCAWLPDGSLVMGKDSKLFIWRPAGAFGPAAASGDGWTELADLSAAGVRGITRLAISRDGRQIAIVAAQPK